MNVWVLQPRGPATDTWNTTSGTAQSWRIQAMGPGLLDLSLGSCKARPKWAPAQTPPVRPKPPGTRTSSRSGASRSPPKFTGASNLPTAEGAEAAAPRSLVPPEEAGADIPQSERKELGLSSAEPHLLGRTALSAPARVQDCGP